MRLRFSRARLRNWIRAELGRLLELHKLKLAAVGTGAGWVVQRLSLTSPDASVRLRAREFIAGIIDRAAAFGAPAIIGSMQGRWGDGVVREQAVSWLAEALEELGARAGSRGVPLLFEPLNRYETNLFNSVTQTAEFLARLTTQSIKVLGDLFHMNIEERDIAGTLQHAGKRLGHVHFADSNRHAAGFGHTDFAAVARALQQMDYDGYVSAEILPLPDSDTAACQTMRTFNSVFR